ncbi:MAG: CaiB/BaiF CoA transferase family protein [Pseudomonadales bacterium]
MSQYLFEGLKVLDVATVIAAPVAATMLADFGADVIKVEQPGDGDLLRALSYVPTTPDADTDFFWQTDGRNKRCISLNLKHPDGMGVLHKLIEQCDVFITNQPLPVRRSLKLNYEDIKPLRPDMIYASLTAYGEDGPDKDAKGFDLVAYWARSGLMDLVRSPGAAPAQALPGLGDHPTGVALYAAIVTALLHRERTGEGGMAHTSLLANGLWSAAAIASGALAGGDVPGYQARVATPLFTQRVYPTRDGRYLQFIMIRSDQELALLLGELELLTLLDDERFATIESRMAHRGAFTDAVAAVLLQRDSADWLSRFEALGISVNRVQTVDEAVRSEQLRINRMVVPPVDPQMPTPWILNHPVKVDGVPQVGPKRAPDPSEHTREILQQLGYSETQVAELIANGAC